MIELVASKLIPNNFMKTYNICKYNIQLCLVINRIMTSRNSIITLLDSEFVNLMFDNRNPTLRLSKEIRLSRHDIDD